MIVLSAFNLILLFLGAVAMRKTLLTRISLPKGLVRTVHKMLESSSTPVTASIFPSLFKVIDLVENT